MHLRGALRGRSSRATLSWWTASTALLPSTWLVPLFTLPTLLAPQLPTLRQPQRQRQRQLLEPARHLAPGQPTLSLLETAGRPLRLALAMAFAKRGVASAKLALMVWTARKVRFVTALTSSSPSCCSLMWSVVSSALSQCLKLRMRAHCCSQPPFLQR